MLYLAEVSSNKPLVTAIPQIKNDEERACGLSKEGETTFFMPHRVFLCSVDSHLPTYGAVVNIRISYYLSEFSPVVNVFNKK
jgi:hypothetical protein